MRNETDELMKDLSTSLDIIFYILEQDIAIDLKEGSLKIVSAPPLPEFLQAKIDECPKTEQDVFRFCSALNARDKRAKRLDPINQSSGKLKEISEKIRS